MRIPLIEEDRKRLIQMYKTSKEKWKAERINIILLKDDGYSQKEISRILRLDENTVCTWVKKYENEETMEKYLAQHYVGYWGKLSSKEMGLLCRVLRENAVTEVKMLKEALKRISNETSYSDSGLVKLLKRLKYVHKQIRLYPTQMDVGKQWEFEKTYISLYDNLTEKETILFIDGVHPQHNTHHSRAWIGKGEELYIKTNSGRNRININGAYNPINQDVIIVEDTTVNAQSTIKLFNKIQAKYPEKDVIHVYSDNARYYKCILLNEYLKDSRIHFMHIPPYSPNVNLIERLWKFLRKKVINIKYYPKFLDFKNAILNFFDTTEMRKEEIKKFIGNDFHIIDPFKNPKIILL